MPRCERIGDRGEPEPPILLLLVGDPGGWPVGAPAGPLRPPGLLGLPGARSAPTGEDSPPLLLLLLVGVRPGGELPPLLLMPPLPPLLPLLGECGGATAAESSAMAMAA